MPDRLDGRIRAFVAELLDDPPEAPPFPHSDPVVVDGDHQRRRRAMETIAPTTEQHSRRWSGPRIALGVGAATVALVLAGFAIITLVDSDEPFGAADGLSVADAYFDAYNAGDVDAVVALFEPGATFTDNFGPQARTDWEQLLVWNAAQGTVLSTPECTVTGEVAGQSATLSCPHTNLDALVQAVDGPPVPIDLTLVISPDGIREWISLFGDPDFNTVSRPFSRWMSANRLDAAGSVGFGNWGSIEEAEENGILTAQYAEEWAAYLTEMGCSYRDVC